VRREASRATPERARLYPIGGICKRLRSFSPLARLRKFEYKVSSMTGFGAEIKRFAPGVTVLSQELRGLLHKLRASYGALHRIWLRIGWDADPNTARGPDIPAASSGNLRRATRARAARDVRTNRPCDGSTVAGWVVQVIAGRAVYR
jgi:hypothetical protein